VIPLESAARELAAVAAELHGRGWLLGTSGNLSAVLARDPLRVAVSRSGADKGRLGGPDFVAVDAEGRVVEGDGRPSDEAGLHLAVIAERGAGSVLHTHSVWATLLTEDAAGAVAIEGYEMLKGLAGVRTHEHREEVPVLENDQDYARLTARVRETLRARPGAHALLLRRHGLYTWGRDLAEARRHVEILEFLFEVRARRAGRGD
jgi:methylthioribulose-1-phosphate dehydratase